MDGFSTATTTDGPWGQSPQRQTWPEDVPEDTRRPQAPAHTDLVRPDQGDERTEDDKSSKMRRGWRGVPGRGGPCRWPVAGRASLGKFLVAGDAAFERVHYGDHGERDGHAAGTERVPPPLGPGGFGAAAPPGRRPALDPGGFGAAAGSHRARNDVGLVARGTGPPAPTQVVGGLVPLGRR